jgi:hypothetical protein
MTINVHREGFDVEGGFQYYVSFKPHPPMEEEEVHSRVPVEAAVSVSETGDLADISFVLPKTVRSDQALVFITRQYGAKYVPPRVFVAIPGSNGDTVTPAAAALDLDLAGRIIGMEIQWKPGEEN